MVHAPCRLMIFLLVLLPGIAAGYSLAQDSKQSTDTAPANQVAVTNVLVPMLTSLGEPSLLEVAKDVTVRSFRVTFFSPVPVHEVAARLTVNADGTGQITSAVSSGSETGVKRTTNNVSKADVDRLLELVDKAGFWAIPSEEPQPAKSGQKYYVQDGFWWMLEGVKSGSFHYVFRQNPKPTAITEIGCYLAKHLVDSYIVPMAPCGPAIAAPPTTQPDRASVNPGFHWNWKDAQELSAEQSLRNAQLAYEQKKAIASAIADEIRPMMSDLEIESEPELQKAAFDTRVKMIDLNDDMVPEVVAQGMVNCGATGNCPFWAFRKAKSGYELLLEGEAQTFTIQTSSSNEFRDIVLARHGSYDSGDLTHYVYRKGSYHEAGCYDYYWTILEGDKVRELKEPRITPCSERNK